MRMCDDGHEEIVWESGVCPMCKLYEEVNALKDELSDKSGEIAALGEENSDLSEKIEALERQPRMERGNDE